MIRLLALARNAFVETIRQPIYGVLILVTFTMLVLDLPLSTWTMGRGSAEYRQTDQLFMITMGLTTLLISGMFVAAFSAAGVLSREIEERTILTIVSKPVPRPVVVAGKFLGVAAALVVAYYLCSLVFLMTVRHKVISTTADPYDVPVIVLGGTGFVLALAAALFCNYFFGWSFASAAVGAGVILLSMAMTIIAFVGKGWKIVPFGSGISPDVLVATLVGLFCVLVLAAAAVAASTRLGLLMTLLVCLVFFGTGLMSHYLFGRFAQANLAARAAYWMVPNFSYFYTMDALTQQRPVPLGYAGLTAVYTLCQVTALLAVGMALFQTRELEARPASGAPLGVAALAGAGRIAAAALAVVGLVRLGGLKDLTDALAGAGLLGGAVAAWVGFGWFGRGVKWTYFLLLPAALTDIGARLLHWGGVYTAPWVRTRGPLTAVALGVGAVVVLILLLPKTRHHFGIIRKSQPVRSGLLKPRAS